MIWAQIAFNLFAISVCKENKILNIKFDDIQTYDIFMI